MKEVLKKNKELIVAIFVVLFLIISGSYAWYTLTKTSEKVNTIKAGSLNMVLNDEASDGILLINAIPMSYQQGIATTEYTFTLTNNGSKSDYTISLKDEATYTDDEGAQVTITADEKIADTKIRYILLKDGEVAEASKSMLLSETVNRIIDSGTIESGTTINYSLRIWIDSKAELGDVNVLNENNESIKQKKFRSRLSVEASQTIPTKDIVIFGNYQLDEGSAYTYKNSNDNVLTISSDGIITSLNEGNSTIDVLNGQKVVKKYNVEVIQNPIVCTKMTYNGTTTVPDCSKLFDDIYTKQGDYGALLLRGSPKAILYFEVLTDLYIEFSSNSYRDSAGGTGYWTLINSIAEDNTESQYAFFRQIDNTQKYEKIFMKKGSYNIRNYNDGGYIEFDEWDYSLN